jgi:class 3 adenylate cyclase
MLPTPSSKPTPPSWLELTNSFVNRAIKLVQEPKDQRELLHNLMERSTLYQEIEQLKLKQLHLIEKLSQDEKEKESVAAELTSLNKELEQKLRLNSFIHRVKPSAASALIKDHEYIERLLAFDTIETFIISIDIRRSTDLMLKAKEPKLFAAFMVELTNALKDIITQHYGVYDKFTGDGVLAYFPEMFSGEDAGFYALKCAEDAHVAFEKIYKKHRNSFISIIHDTGLGIGIDYGQIYIDQLDSEDIVVGTPVVYATRLSGVKAGNTLLNQQAYDVVTKRYKKYLKSEEYVIEFKNEGQNLAYKMMINTLDNYVPKKPKWERESS